jgi:hypothetical protein
MSGWTTGFTGTAPRELGQTGEMKMRTSLSARSLKKRLYIEGHSIKHGYVVRLELVDAPPVRMYRDTDLRKVRAIVDRFNRIQLRK